MTLLGLMAGWSGGVREQAWRSASRARRWDWTICRLLLLALVWQCPQTAAWVWQCPQTAACRKSVGGAERGIFREKSLSDASLRRLRRADYHSAFTMLPCGQAQR